jgi:uncharacterized protein YidB (DUF937 family)
MSPITIALLGLLAYKAYNKFTAPQPNAADQAPPADPRAAADGGLGDLLQNGLGGLGGLLAGGAAGGLLSGGLGGLLQQFEQSGHGDVARSWVGTGENKDISPDDLGHALGDDTVNTLAEQAGLSRIELLQGLSRQLPGMVDRLTPQGRLPTADEISRMA